MKNTIGIRLTELCSQHVNFYFSEAETEQYPYAVYTMNVSSFMTKDGVHRYDADVTITVYSKDFDAANQIQELIADSIQEGMNGAVYASKWVSTTASCTDGVWAVELTYTIKQFKK